MTGLIGPVTMAGFHCGENWLEIKALMTHSDLNVEIIKDGSFIAYDNGTILDMVTSLMWAAKDNGSSVNWAPAKSYCENYRGGHTDAQRMA